MQHKLKALAALAAVALVTGGLSANAQGASSVVPKHTLITRADRACTDFHKRVSKVPEPKVDFAHLRSSDLPAIARYIARIHPLMAKLDGRLHSLGLPDSDAGTWKAILGDFEGDMRLLDAQWKAARDGDVAATKRAVARGESPNGPGERGSKLARRFGLKACG